MKLYVASSWKNPLYETTTALLRQFGHEILDWKEGGGFHWSQVTAKPVNEWDAHFYREVLGGNHYAKSGFNSDWSKMNAADACVLLLPCGRSAHLEAGWFVGNGKPLHIYIPHYDTPELMYSMANSISLTIEELIASIG